MCGVLDNSGPTDYIMTDASGVQTCLTQVSQVKDLSVWFTHSLTPSYSSMSESNQQSHAGHGND